MIDSQIVFDFVLNIYTYYTYVHVCTPDMSTYVQYLFSTLYVRTYVCMVRTVHLVGCIVTGILICTLSYVLYVCVVCQLLSYCGHSERGCMDARYYVAFPCTL